MKPGGKIISIQVLRAIASLLVLQVHLFTTIPFTTKIFCGSIGVDIFFVISGYIIAESVSRLPTTKPAATFLINRFSRVAPYYYLLTVVAAILVFLFSHQLNVSRLIKSFLFIPDQKYDPTLFLGWSLIHEMFFYLFVTLMIFLRPGIEMVWVALSFFCFISICSFFSSSAFILAFFGASMNYTFLIGVLIFIFRDKIIPLFHNKIWLICSCVLLFFTALFTVDAPFSPEQRALMSEKMYRRDSVFLYATAIQIPRVIIWGIPAAFLFICFLAQESSFKNWSKSLIVKIGDASYSLYLVQAFTVLLILKISFLNTGLTHVFLAFATVYISLKMFKIESFIGNNSKQFLKRRFI